MREEKKFLVAEVVGHLEKSNYCYVAGFDRLTVADVAELRKRLHAQSAEYHVVKNSVLNLAVQECNLPQIEREALCGATAVIVGGVDASAVAKILNEFASNKENEGKLVLKGGLLEGSYMSAQDVIALSKLPSLSVLRAQLLSLLQAPMQKLLLVCNAVPQGFLRVLVAYSEK